MNISNDLFAFICKSLNNYLYDFDKTIKTEIKTTTMGSNWPHPCRLYNNWIHNQNFKTTVHHLNIERKI